MGRKWIRLSLRDSDVSIQRRASRFVVRTERKDVEYSLDDIKALLAALTEPSRVLMAVAAYTGFHRGEIVA